MASRLVRAAVLAGLLAALLSGLLSGCADPAASATPTVTVTVTVPGPGSSTGPTTGEDDVEPVRGRTHDVGTIVEVRTDGTALVLELDRWTVDGVADAVVARDGVPLVADPGDRFVNRNDERTYEVRVADGARAVVNTCERPADPAEPAVLVSTPVALEDFLDRADRSTTVVLLTYAKGALTRLETSPRC